MYEIITKGVVFLFYLKALLDFLRDGVYRSFKSASERGDPNEKI